ncbi:MAG: hypothetical protein J6M18_06030 [Actinomycetaceae bacterium]|nr:hypothetical protein [Actinomycetaceae bacterium]
MLGKKYYFNTRTHKVEYGKQSPWIERMGPYKTYEEASLALDIVKERNTIEDEKDREWEN